MDHVKFYVARNIEPITVKPIITWIYLFRSEFGFTMPVDVLVS